MVDPRARDVRFDEGPVVILVAEEGIVIAFDGATVQRRNAAIGDALVIVVGIAGGNRRIGSDERGEGGADADEAPFVDVAIARKFLVSGIQSHRHAVADRLIDVGGEGPGAEAVDAAIDAGCGVERVGFLGDAVDDAAAAAATEDQRVRALEHLDPADIVERAVILCVVAQTVDVEIRRGFLAADEDFVAVPFARFEADARRVAQRVAKRADALVVQLFFGDHVDRLRHVDQGGVGLGRGGTVLDIVAVAAIARDEDVARKVLVVGIGVCDRRNGKSGREQRCAESIANQGIAPTGVIENQLQERHYCE